MLWREATYRIAALPKHPDKVKIRGLYYDLTEQQIYDYYDKVKDKIIEEVKGHNVLLIVGIDGMIVRRNTSEGKPIRINSVEDFDKINNGSVLEFHREFTDHTTKVLFVDIDPREKFPWVKTKSLACGSWELFNRDPRIEKVEGKFSGGRGFHIIAHLKHSVPTDRAREMVKEILQPLTSEKVTFSLPHSDDMCRLDVTLLKPRGTLRCTWSLNSRTGLVALPLKKNEIMHFSKRDASIFKVLKEV